MPIQGRAYRCLDLDPRLFEHNTARHTARVFVVMTNLLHANPVDDFSAIFKACRHLPKSNRGCFYRSSISCIPSSQAPPGSLLSEGLWILYLYGGRCVSLLLKMWGRLISDGPITPSLLRKVKLFPCLDVAWLEREALRLMAETRCLIGKSIGHFVPAPCNHYSCIKYL